MLAITKDISYLNLEIRLFLKIDNWINNKKFNRILTFFSISNWVFFGTVFILNLKVVTLKNLNYYLMKCSKE